MNLFKIFYALVFVTFVASEVTVKEIVNVCKELDVQLLDSKSLLLDKFYYAKNVLKNVRFFHADVQRKVVKIENDIITVSRVEDNVSVVERLTRKISSIILRMQANSKMQVYPCLFVCFLHLLALLSPKQVIQSILETSFSKILIVPVFQI